jgi:hypothetical protein
VGILHPKGSITLNAIISDALLHSKFQAGVVGYVVAYIVRCSVSGADNKGNICLGTESLD